MAEGWPHRLQPDHGLHRVARAGMGIAGAAVLAGVLAAPAGLAQCLRSYLMAWVFWTGVALGCLAILMIHHVTGGAWGVAVRRFLECGTRTLPLMAILFLPLALGVQDLYAWARPEAAADHVIAQKQLYLNVPFFLARAAFYFAAWIGVARLLARWSLAQDDASDPRAGYKLEQLSRGGLLLLGLTMTFAAVDWMMSLEPHWFSTVYGVLFMVGSVLSAFALVIPVVASVAVRKPFADVVTPEHFHDLGKLLLAFVMLWAYVTLSQFLIVWSANLPEEIPWYLRRLQGGWQWLALLLVAVHFALPFVLLLSRDLKRSARGLAALALVLLAARFADVFWLLAPALDRPALAVHWLDPVALLGVGGLWMAVYVRALAAVPLVPRHDLSLPLEAA
jgi:hypothetical protein